jgi:hypothetical protein
LEVKRILAGNEKFVHAYPWDFRASTKEFSEGEFYRPETRLGKVRMGGS